MPKNSFAGLGGSAVTSTVMSLAVRSAGCVVTMYDTWPGKPFKNSAPSFTPVPPAAATEVKRAVESAASSNRSSRLMTHAGPSPSPSPSPAAPSPSPPSPSPSDAPSPSPSDAPSPSPSDAPSPSPSDAPSPSAPSPSAPSPSALSPSPSALSPSAGSGAHTPSAQTSALRQSRSLLQ